MSAKTSLKLLEEIKRSLDRTKKYPSVASHFSATPIKLLDTSPLESLTYKKLPDYSSVRKSLDLNPISAPKPTPVALPLRDRTCDEMIRSLKARIQRD